MPVVRRPDQLPARGGPGWTELSWAGADGLDTLIAESTGPSGSAGPALAKVFAADELPHLGLHPGHPGDRCTWAPGG
jgi:hypothetical protein